MGKREEPIGTYVGFVGDEEIFYKKIEAKRSEEARFEIARQFLERHKEDFPRKTTLSDIAPFVSVFKTRKEDSFPVKLIIEYLNKRYTRA